MQEIVLSVLPDWYSNKVRKKIEPVRKKGQKIIEKIQIILNDISGSCNRLGEVTTVSERDEITTKSVDHLARKYQDKIHEIEIPTEPLIFDKIAKFSLNIKNLLQYFWHQGRRWVPKLRGPAGQSYKTNIRELNYHIRSLHEEWANLEGLIEKDLKRVKVFEDIFDQIEKMKSVLKEIDEKKEELKIIESQLAQLNNNKLKLEAEHEQVKNTPIITERIKHENDLQGVIQTLRGVLGYFRKPMRKFEKLLGEGNYFVRPGCSEFLTKYINNPLETFFDEQDDYSNLKMLLLELKKAAPRLTLKSRDEKKLFKEIEDINNGSLLPYRQKYKESYQQFQVISEKLEKEGLLAKLEEIKNKIAIIQKEISDVEQNYSRLKDNYEKNLIKVRDIRDYLEKAIHSTTNEKIKINL